MDNVAQDLESGGGNNLKSSREWELLSKFKPGMSLNVMVIGSINMECPLRR